MHEEHDVRIGLQPDAASRLQTCGHLERQAADLEATAHPALDALTRVVTTANLERVRPACQAMLAFLDA